MSCLLYRKIKQYRRIILFSFFCFSPSIHSDEMKKEDSCNWPQEWRQKALIRLNQMLGKAIPFASRTFSLVALQKKIEGTTWESLGEFERMHRYFSCIEPLVGVVSSSQEDLGKVEKAFSSFASNQDLLLSQIAIGEILVKALAYRNLDKGCVIKIPFVVEGVLEKVEYQIDEVLDLWMGMPAFGLVPVSKHKACSILLFRGTDFSFLSKRGWASILSDLDV